MTIVRSYGSLRLTSLTLGSAKAAAATVAGMSAYIVEFDDRDNNAKTRLCCIDTSRQYGEDFLTNNGVDSVILERET